MKKLLLTLSSVIFTTTLMAQFYCAQHIIEGEMRANDPQLEQKFEAFKSEVFGKESNGERADLRIIPVVFHVIHDNGPENISEAQILDAMRILNEDYAAENPELTEVVSSFTNNIGTGDIEFRLARKDPDGNSTNGIDRIQSQETYVGDDGSKLNPWPRDMYLNIWVTDVIYISGAAAYAYRPPAADGNPSADGIIANHRYVGSIGTASGTGGKTLTHEVGHYLGLPHTWGETNAPGCDGSQAGEPCNGANNCTLDDGISDTPNCLGVSAGNCDLNRTTCGSLDNVQNFMDYASCEAMFTNGQVTTMRAALNSGVADRNDLWTPSNLQATGVGELSAANFYMESRAACKGDSVQLFDASTYGATSWNWSITGPAEYTSTAEHPVFVFERGGVYHVELTVSDGFDTETITEMDAFVIAENFGDAVPFEEHFDEAGDWITYNNQESSTQNVWEYDDEFGSETPGCYKVKNIGSSPNQDDDLMYASVDFRTLSSIDISFDVAYAQIAPSSYDKLSLDIMSECDGEWRTVWSKFGSTLAGSTPLAIIPFEPTESDWETFNISNLPTAWFSGNTVIRFRFTSGGGNNIYLDDINIAGDYTTTPALVYPDNGEQNMGSTTVIDWRAIPGVDHYEYQLDESESFNGGAMQSGTLTALGDASDKEDTEYTATGLEPGKTYFWRVKSNTGGSPSGWSDTWSFRIAQDGVGVNEVVSSNIQLRPNPAQHQVTVVAQEFITGLSIFSMAGALISEHSTGTGVSNAKLDIQHLKPGTYFIQIEQGANSTFMPLVVQP